MKLLHICMCFQSMYVQCILEIYLNELQTANFTSCRYENNYLYHVLLSDHCVFFVFMKVCGTTCVEWIVMAMLPTTLRQSRLSCTMNTKHHLSRYVYQHCVFS